MEATSDQSNVFSGDDTIKLVKQFIRYDIPFVMLGISSIGKSYSILDMATRWRMPHSVLYIGSEKPSNIEGLPRLVGRRSETGDMLEFFKPNWFPNSLLIADYVSNGKVIFENFVEKAYKGNKKGVLDGSDFSSMNEIFEGLFLWKWQSTSTEIQDMVLAKVGTENEKLNKPFKVERELLDEKELFDKTTENPNFTQKDQVRDMCLYLSTILGYGNFWLILDELDKVDEAEKDKYAPLLHIVRERTIKSFSMQTLNDGEGAGVPMQVEKGGYHNIKHRIDTSIEKKFPLLDTRVIGIANATANIEEALFRRFAHVIIEDVMMVSSPPKQLAELRNCLSRVTVKAVGGQNHFLSNLDFKLLAEVNLQWQFSFFPKIINQEDGINNYFIQNLQENISLSRSSLGAVKNILSDLKSDFTVTSLELTKRTANTALFKVIRNNYGLDDEMDTQSSVQFQSEIYACIVQQVLSQGNFVQSIVTQGSNIPDEGTDEIEQQANYDIIQEALGMFNGNAVQASKYLIAQNLSEYQKLAKKDGVNNSSVKEFVDSSLKLVESAKGTVVQNNLFVGILSNAYMASIFSNQTYDFTAVQCSYINKFNQLAQKVGFEWDSDVEITTKALETLQIDEDTLLQEENGKSPSLVEYNNEMAKNAFMVFALKADPTDTAKWKSSVGSKEVKSVLKRFLKTQVKSLKPVMETGLFERASERIELGLSENRP